MLEAYILEIENVCSITQVRIYSEYSLNPKEIPWAPPSDFPCAQSLFHRISLLSS